ncbi:MAG: CmcJ/NvfI family oxidoreductase [Acidimicrobiales bacterium]
MTRDRSVSAKLRYINAEWRNSAEPPRIGSRESRRANTAEHEVLVQDARAATGEFGLELSGFALRAHPATDVGATNAEARASYREAMLELVRQESGATRTVLFADLVRTEDTTDFNTAYSRFVHCDYNLASTRRMSHDLLRHRGLQPDDAASYAWYNTWQPFDHDATQNPLAVLDVRSLDASDIIPYRYSGYSGEDGEGGLVSAPVFNPLHRWYFYPDMTPSEVLLTKQLDLRPGHTQQCPHTSFLDDTRAADTPPRRSIETRILAIFER